MISAVCQLYRVQIQSILFLYQELINPLFIDLNLVSDSHVFCFASALQHAEEVRRKGASFARDVMIEENWSKYLRFFVTMLLNRALPLRTAIQMCPVQVRYLVFFYE